MVSLRKYFAMCLENIGTDGFAVLLDGFMQFALLLQGIDGLVPAHGPLALTSIPFFIGVCLFLLICKVLSELLDSACFSGWNRITTRSRRVILFIFFLGSIETS